MSSGEKHPLSLTSESRDTTCWREHLDGVICLLPEGHLHPYLVTVAAMQLASVRFADIPYGEQIETLYRYILDTPTSENST